MSWKKVIGIIATLFTLFLLWELFLFLPALITLATNSIVFLLIGVIILLLIFYAIFRLLKWSFK